MPRLEYLDGWRGIAILVVLIAHFFGGLDARFGVDAFFVLSGWLISGILFEQRMPLGKFYRRRISRVIPTFLLFTTVAILVSAIVGGEFTRAEIITTYLFLRTYLDPHIWLTDLPIGNLWTLNIEEHAYSLLAIVAATPLVNRRIAVLLLALGCATFIAMALYHFGTEDPPEAWRLRTECASGALLLSAGYRLIAKNIRVPKWAPIAAFAIAFCCYWLSRYVSLTIPPFLLAFSICHLGQTYACVLRALSWKPLQYLGFWSFSLYLWQQLFYEYDIPFGLPLAFMVSLVSYYCYEQPIRNWLNTNWKSWRFRLGTSRRFSGASVCSPESRSQARPAPGSPRLSDSV